MKISVLQTCINHFTSIYLKLGRFSLLDEETEISDKAHFELENNLLIQHCSFLCNTTASNSVKLVLNPPTIVREQILYICIQLSLFDHIFSHRNEASIGKHFYVAVL